MIMLFRALRLVSKRAVELAHSMMLRARTLAPVLRATVQTFSDWGRGFVREIFYGVWGGEARAEIRGSNSEDHVVFDVIFDALWCTSDKKCIARLETYEGLPGSVPAAGPSLDRSCRP